MVSLRGFSGARGWLLLGGVEWHDGDRAEDDGAVFEMNLEEGVLLQPQSSPYLGRQSHAPVGAHGNDASHAVAMLARPRAVLAI